MPNTPRDFSTCIFMRDRVQDLTDTMRGEHDELVSGGVVIKQGVLMKTTKTLMYSSIYTKRRMEQLGGYRN
jgi:hypothetical protein